MPLPSLASSSSRVSAGAHEELVAKRTQARREGPHERSHRFRPRDVGRAVTKLLLEGSDAVRVAQRTRPADLSSGATYTACDILERDAVQRAIKGLGKSCWQWDSFTRCGFGARPGPRP